MCLNNLIIRPTIRKENHKSANIRGKVFGCASALVYTHAHTHDDLHRVRESESESECQIIHIRLIRARTTTKTVHNHKHNKLILIVICFVVTLAHTQVFTSFPSNGTSIDNKNMVCGARAMLMRNMVCF